MAPLPARDQRHPWLKYEGHEYTDAIIHDYEDMLGWIFGRQALTDQLRMVYIGAEGQILFTSDAWIQVFKIRRSLVLELMLEFFSTCRISDVVLNIDHADTLSEEIETDGFRAYSTDNSREIATKANLSDYLSRIASDGDFLGTIPSYTSIWDPLRRLCHRLITTFLREVMHLRRHAEGRKQGVRMSGGQFTSFRDLTVIDMDELARLHICKRLGDTWAWVACECGLRAAGVAPQAHSAARGPRTMPQRMSRLEDEVYGLRESLGEQREVLSRMSRDFARLTTWTSRTKRSTGEASTSAAPHTDDQSDP
ncbi:hypothetical protein Tco_0710942 [Tanacetum coccineum]